MQAAVMRSYGGPEVLRLETVAEPIAAAGEVAVRLQASGLNWHDVLVRKGQYASPLPHIPGADGVGVRRDTGEEVIVLPSLRWGTRQAAPEPDFEILGDQRQGTYAEMIVVPEECVVPRPKGYQLAEAAALGLTGLTVFRALFTRGRLRKAENVLILGAGGGVATTAVSQARAVGAEVFVTSGSQTKIDAAKELGARDGVVHHDAQWVSHAKSLTPGGRGFDLVLDSVGRWEESIQLLRPGGRCVVLGASVAERVGLDVRPFYFGQYELIGTTLGSPKDMAMMLNFIAERRMPPPPVDSVFRLDQAAAAHERMESGLAIGRIALEHS